jgi:hypothetical protein
MMEAEWNVEKVGPVEVRAVLRRMNPAEWVDTERGDG